VQKAMRQSGKDDFWSLTARGRYLPRETRDYVPLILAAVVVPMVIITLSRALRERFDRHRAIARWTFPVWMYVSVTGVIVYVMLYHLFAP